MPRRRELCESRNTATGKPCKLSKNACRYLEHRKPDKTVTPISAAQQQSPSKNASAAQQQSPSKNASAAQQQSAGVHPGGPTPAALNTMLQQCSHGILNPAVIERDYWMFQVARMLQADSKKHPGSPACMSGGSMLALVGITQRLSEDADFAVSFPGGLAACSNKQGKKLLDEYQQRVAADLGVTAQRQGPGGGNLFRTVLYEYVSALPNVVDPAVESDMGIRDIDPKYIITLPGQPYVARAGMPLPASTGGAPIRCMHPITTLVDKLDAVCWREGSVAANPQQALASLSARVRDHYDIYMLIAWLADNNQLNAHNVRDAVAHMQHSDAEVRKRRNVNRPIEPPPADGYRTLRAWQPGTVEYQHLQQAYPSLQAFVYGPLPPWPAVASRMRGCRFI